MNSWTPGRLYFTNVAIPTTLSSCCKISKRLQALRGLNITFQQPAMAPCAPRRKPMFRITCVSCKQRASDNSNQQPRRGRRDQRTQEIYRIIIQHPASLQQNTQETVSDHANNRRNN